MYLAMKLSGRCLVKSNVDLKLVKWEEIENDLIMVSKSKNDLIRQAELSGENIEFV